MTNKAIGGFNGGFGNCQFVANKKAKLVKEGLAFDAKNVLKSNDMGNDSIFTAFWQGPLLFIAFFRLVFNKHFTSSPLVEQILRL